MQWARHAMLTWPAPPQRPTAPHHIISWLLKGKLSFHCGWTSLYSARAAGEPPLMMAAMYANQSWHLAAAPVVGNPSIRQRPEMPRAVDDLGIWISSATLPPDPIAWTPYQGPSPMRVIWVQTSGQCVGSRTPGAAGAARACAAGTSAPGAPATSGAIGPGATVGAATWDDPAVARTASAPSPGRALSLPLLCATSGLPDGIFTATP